MNAILLSEYLIMFGLCAWATWEIMKSWLVGWCYGPTKSDVFFGVFF